MRVGVWGHYHGGNQGDDCVVSAIIGNVRARRPDAEILGFSMNPQDTRRRHGVDAYPIRRAARRRVATEERQVACGAPSNGEIRAVAKRVLKRVAPLYRALVTSRDVVLNVAGEAAFLVESYRNLRGVDALVVAGSGPVSDEWGGAWGYPYTLLKWALLSRIAGAKFLLLCVGAGPIDGSLSRWFLRLAIRLSHYRSFRDESSAALVRDALGVDAGPVLPDLAFSLRLNEVEARRPPVPIPRGRAVVGLNPMPHFDLRYQPDGDTARYDRYLRKLTGVTAWLLQNGYTVLLVPTQVPADPRMSADLLRLLETEVGLRGSERIVNARVSDLSDLMGWLDACDYTIAGRFHGIILSYLRAKPCLALAYHPKTWDLTAAMGQGAFCLDIESFEVDILIERFREMERRRESIRAELKERCLAKYRLLEAQYERVIRDYLG